MVSNASSGGGAPTVLDCAYLAWGAYHNHAVELRGFTRDTHARGNDGDHFSGFHSAVYRRPSGGATERVVALAGTELHDNVDGRADLGFGGTLTDKAAATSDWMGDAVNLLRTQGARAVQLAEDERRRMNRGDRLLIVGHSLGGGLAQIAAAKTGITAVTFNPAAVGALADVVASYERNRPVIVNFRYAHDIVNGTARFTQGGKPFLGKVHWVQTTRRLVKAHDIGGDIKELKPGGVFAALGASDPLAVAAG